jgi:putative ABC transport system ATP-binding protein
VITHNVSIGQMADRVITMQDGRIATQTRNQVKLAASELAW